MKSTPPELKWLAEKRARTAGQLQRHEIALACTQVRATKVLENLSRLRAETESLRQDLLALDRTIGGYDVQLDATAIEPIHGWQGVYGNRGALKSFVLEMIEDRAPSSISTSDLEKLALLQFALTFDSPAFFRQWRLNSLRGAIKALARQGLIERSDLNPETGARYWRYKPKLAPTLAGLRELAQAADVAEVST